MATLSTSEESETEGISESLTVLIARELEEEISKNKKRKRVPRPKNIPSRKSQVPTGDPQVPSPEKSPERMLPKAKKGQETSKSNPALRGEDDKLPLVSPGHKSKVNKSLTSPAKRTRMPRIPPGKQEVTEELIDVEDISLEKDEGDGRRRFLRAIDKVIEANRSSQHEVSRSLDSSSPRQRM